MRAIAGALILCTVYVHGYGFNATTGHSWITGALVGFALTLIVTDVASSHDRR